MSVAEVIPRHWANYGAVVGTSSHHAIRPGAASLRAVQSQRMGAELSSRVSSLSGQWLEREWAAMQRGLADTLLRSSPKPIETFSWFETSPDAVYPSASVVEVLDVEVTEDSSADAFAFTDTDFDVWYF